jgi:hypothetical protein
MEKRRKLFSIAGILFFTAGILIGMALCGWYGWGEVEASLFIFRTGEVTLKLNCPLMIGSNEESSVIAYFNNPTTAEIRPTVRVDIRHKDLPREESQVLTLSPGEMQRVEWKVDRSDRDFGSLIMVNVFETSQADFSSGQGSCGIMFFPLPIRGKTVLNLLTLISMLGILAGGWMWTWGNSPLKGTTLSLRNAMGTLAIAVAAGLVSILLHWWVLSGLLFFGTTMLIVVIVTEFWWFPHASIEAKKR